MKTTTAFEKICRMKHKTKVVQGSQGAGKTFSILLRWILLAARSETKQFCSIVTATFPALESGAIKDFKTICDILGMPYRETKKPYIFRIGLWTFQFFSIDKESKGLGARRDRLYINEANRLPWKIAKQLISRTHVERIFDFNPVNTFWAHTEFVNVKDCAFVKLTYKDNECLPQSEIDDIEKSAPWGLRPDPNHWRVYGEGEIGMPEGIIFGNYKEYIELPEGEYQIAVGVDFGWEDPLAFVKTWLDHKNKRIYWKLLFYGSQAKYEDVIPEIKPEIVGETCYCDHEPRDIQSLRDFGLTARNANKKNGITADLRAIKQYEIFIHTDSTALKSEMAEYSYQTIETANGTEIIPYPKPNQVDHAIDAAKYSVATIISRK